MRRVIVDAEDSAAALVLGEDMLHGRLMGHECKW